GRRPGEIVNARFLDHIADDQLPGVMGFSNRRARGSTERFRYETALKHKNGSRVEVEISAGLITYQGGPADLVIIGDVTERNRERAAKEKLEKELAVSKKMEALGLLAGGVAHDLNNVLSGVVSYPELLLMDDDLAPSIKKNLEVILKSGSRAAAIVEDLLTVARGVASVKKAADLNDIIEDYVDLPEFERLKAFHPSVDFEAAYDERPLMIKASMVHIGKVLMNLTSNAAEAFTDARGGKVRISTRFEDVAAPVKGWSVVEPGEYAVLRIRDDGPGISPEDIERIFEPFYSKKVMGRSGTGLGLTVVWNTMQDHKGGIDVTSDSGGTTFDLYFPIVEEEEAEAEAAMTPDDYRGNGESILIVDDVEEQRLIARRILESLGYRATAVAGGEEAVAYLEERTADLLVLDMIMEPGVNGRETYERILRIHPGQRAVIASGYSETDDVKKTLALGASAFISKPYSVEKIGVAVKKALESQAPS
ncbi:MAG: response regulator, partial [Desulfobacterales bacterium]|nr:response regulator [Desulfobacterales bacterium]